MLEQKLISENKIHQIENEFYSKYDWCINPFLTLKDLFNHLLEELERYHTLSIKWQREESLINLYLFASAISCIVNDFISWKPFDIRSLIDKYSKFRTYKNFFHSLINLPYSIISYRKIKLVNKWEKKWRDLVEEFCKILLSKDDIKFKEINELKTKFLNIRNILLPTELLNRRMKLNEGFRCQDLTHHDVISLANKFIKSEIDKDKKIIVIGPRTAGSYFAPLIKVYLEQCGYKKTFWITIRPKKGLNRKEKSYFKKHISKNTNIILVDDYSNTGNSFRLVQNIIKKFGVIDKSITILAPIHPFKLNVNISNSKDVKILTLLHHELYKNNFLNSISIEQLLNEYLSDEEWSNIKIRKNTFVDLLNQNFENHYSDSFQVKLKKLFEIYSQNQIHQINKQRIISKSVGWGWLGYHAYLTGIRLQNFVPKIIGLRNGILFSEWIEGRHLDHQIISDKYIEKISSYIAKRVQKLSLNEDPLFNIPNISWGWLEILSILRRAYGVRAGYLKYKILRKELKKNIKTIPTLIDGKMIPDEWIVTSNGIIKSDFEQHNFGAPELDVVDPAYDLAAAIFEFNFSETEEEKFIANYISECGDETIYDRIIIYKLLYASIVKNKSEEKLLENNSNTNVVELNQRYLKSRNFLIYKMNQFCSRILKTEMIPVFKRKLFFLDLDGVFDNEIFGFPHTTLSGLASIALLKANSYSIILNTGRSIEHVQNYCSTYKFEGGIAEYGSVICDNIAMKELPLIDEGVYFQLAALREALKNISGVFLDGDYKYSIRAYRFSKFGTKGLNEKESNDLLNILHLDKIKIINRSADTYFVGKETSKGNALLKFKNYVKHNDGIVVAIGDSDEDISMLNLADNSYSPANCSLTIKKLARQKKYNVVTKSNQRGLFESVNILLKKKDKLDLSNFINSGKPNTIYRLLFYLLWRAEQSKVEKIIALLNWNKL